MKAAPDKSRFCSNSRPVIFLGHIIKETTISTLKSRLDAIFQPQLPCKKKKIAEFHGMLNFFSKNPHEIRLYLWPNYNILRQQKNFEWTLEHYKRFDEIEKLLTEQISNTIPFSNYAMCDASIFGNGATLLQSHQSSKKTHLISAYQYSLHKQNYDSQNYER